MRRWNELTKDEKEKAQKKALETILMEVCEGILVFGAKVQEHLDKAIEEMERMQTPWFLAERLMEDEFLTSKFHKWASRLANLAFYPDPNENILRI